MGLVVVAKAIASLLILFELLFALLVFAGVLSVDVAVGISMQPFIETGAVLITMNPDYYEKYINDNFTNKMVEYIAFGDMVWINNLTGERVTVHFKVPTPIAHLCTLDKGDYLIVHGLNNDEWYEIVPRENVLGVVILVLDIRLALALAVLIGLFTATAIFYGFYRRV